MYCIESTPDPSMIDAKVILSCIDSNFEDRLRSTLREIQESGGIYRDMHFSDNHNPGERLRTVIILYEDCQ